MNNKTASPDDSLFRAGIQYPSGRRIYLGRTPEIGEFYSEEQVHRSWLFPSHDAAAEAIATIIRYFRIINLDAIKPVIHPCARVVSRTPGNHQ